MRTLGNHAHHREMLQKEKPKHLTLRAEIWQVRDLNALKLSPAHGRSMHTAGDHAQHRGMRYKEKIDYTFAIPTLCDYTCSTHLINFLLAGSFD